ncbi:MAG: NADH-quinone oxidoreductase subunit L [Phycisphaerae bacterium]|nr:NADH-quinone oxidoreductase subunit L [Phycisphaerae bacterium]
MSEPAGILGFMTLAAEGGHGAASSGGPAWFAAVPLLPLAASILCGLTIAFRVKTKLPAVITVAALAVSFGVTVAGFLSWSNAGHATQIADIYEWIGVSWGSDAGQTLSAKFGFYMDGLSWLWMLFVTGLATLIALYASEYMGHDVGKGYGRFFAAFALFVFSMACLVMGDNLILLYLGWEGVGLCSYLLIGYFFQKPSAVAAAKKAFIVNRIGDLGLAVGIFLTFVTFGTVEYGPLFEMVRQGVDAAGRPLSGQWQEWVIPCLLMIGAFGKSAQFPLYVWLPDAMEGPTPVSALIHAATMVTAGVYLIARTMPLFLLDDSHFALTIVAWTGTITALLAATIGMAQFDIKRIMAYSTVSQLGYMFAGLGVLTSVGAAFHVFTHAFFKALLFLACGAVMHGFAGQLDLRRLSGVQKMPGWRIVGLTMLVGCLNLAGFPLITSGYFSKDMILAQAFTTPGEVIAGSRWIGWILLFTAGLTAYYTFRVYFRVFVGPQHFEPGEELHAADHDHHGGHDDHGGHARDAAHGHDGAHDFHPHPPGWAINSVLVILAACSFLAIPTYFMMTEHHGWVGSMVHSSTAFVESPGSHHVEGAHAERLGTFLGMDPHKVMYYVSGLVGFIGIGIAWFLHLSGRTGAATSRADALLPMLGPVPRWAQNKWYVDEFYEAVIRLPLWVLASLFHWFDKLVIDGLVDLCGLLPRWFARAIRPSQSGVLQGYAVGMAGGLAVILVIVLIVMGANV